MSNTTNFSTNEDVYPGINCMILDSSSHKYGILIGYSFVCLIPTSIGFYAIIWHYCNSEKDLLSQLRIFNTLATLCFVLFDLDTIIDIYFAMKCDLTHLFWIRYDSYGNIFWIIGYHLLYLIFVLKLKYSFKDSIFQVSKLQMTIITIIGIISFILGCIGLVLTITNNSNHLLERMASN